MKLEREIRQKRDEMFTFRKEGRRSKLLSNKEIDAQIMVLNWVLEEPKQYEIKEEKVSQK